MEHNESDGLTESVTEESASQWQDDKTQSNESAAAVVLSLAKTNRLVEKGQGDGALHSAETQVTREF